MKILVPTKRVPDTDQKITVSADGSRIEVDQLPFILNPFDAIALEEALRIRETGLDSKVTAEVIAVGIGVEDYEEQLRTALAMGADRAIRVACDSELDPWNVAVVLSKMVERESPDIVLMGKQAVDDDCNQAGQFLAALLDWPQATFASKVELMEGGVRVARETDFGIETVQLPLPALITADLRLNEPRYASLPSIMRARKKQIEEVSMSELDVEPSRRMEVLSVRAEHSARQRVLVDDVRQLADRIQSARVSS